LFQRKRTRSLVSSKSSKSNLPVANCLLKSTATTRRTAWQRKIQNTPNIFPNKSRYQFSAEYIYSRLPVSCPLPEKEESIYIRVKVKASRPNQARYWITFGPWDNI